MTPEPGFYGRLARFAMRHQALTLALVVLATIVAAVFSARLRVDSNILALMPKDEPSVFALRLLDDEEHGVNFLTLALDASDRAALDTYVARLTAELEVLPEVEYAISGVDDALAWRLGLLQVPISELTTLRDRLHTAIQVGPLAANPLVAARLFDLGPLSERLASAGADVPLLGAEGVARILVRPSGSAHDIPFARALMASVDRVIAANPPADVGVRVLWIGGAYRHNVEDYEGIVQDIAWITGASGVMVLIIVAFAFRTPRALIALFVPLLLSGIWTMGVAGATVGSLNSFTSTVNAILLGLGVDFGIHLYARYREERSHGHEVEEAVVRAWDFVGSACTSAALTSAGAFSALLLAEFDGFRQLGWLLGLGLLLCLVAEVVLMPILLSWVERHGVRHHFGFQRRVRNRRRRPSTYRLAPVVVAILVGFTLVAALVARNIQFEYDISEMRRAGMAYTDLDAKEQELARDSYAPIVVTFDDAASLDAAHARLSTRVEQGLLPEIGTVLSIRSVLPPDQAERVALLQEIAAMADAPNAVFLPASVLSNLQRLRATDVRVLTADDLPGPVRHILGASQGHHRLLLLPTGNMWDMREATLLDQAIRRELPDERLASEFLTLSALYAMMLRDGPFVAAVALGLVVLFTAWDLRRLGTTAGAVSVLLAGCAWWGALLTVAQIKISVINVVGVPIVLGIGIDVMIHLIHRISEEGPGKLLKSLATTGWASALATLTTVVAFAGLSFATSQGLRSLGLLVLLGEVAVTVAGFILVPLGFATAWRFAGRHPIVDPDPGASPEGASPTDAAPR